MKIKPHVFIGSSSEGLPAAQVLKARLSLWANCDIWKDPGVFELNKGYLQNLLDRLNLYEYGIMIATGDDATKSRGETKMAPRDNVVFELGLFMGRLGRDRTFFVFEKDSKLPTDLLGITLPQFPKGNGRARDRALQLCAEMIEAHVKSRSGIFEGGIFPVHQTITEFLKLSHVESDQKEKLVEAREIRRFKLVLDHLIKKSSATKNKVRTEIVDI